MNTEVVPTPKPNRTRLYVVGGIVLLLLLAAAAFLAGRLMNNGSAGGLFGPGLFGMGGPGKTMVRIELTPAAELPVVQPDVRGIFSSRDGNSLIIHPQDGIKVIMGPDGGGLVDESSGPEIEVVVTRDTKVYRDATQHDFKEGSQGVQQVVEAGDLEEINSQTFLTVWGRKTDNRIIADVILYTAPMMGIKPAAQ